MTQLGLLQFHAVDPTWIPEVLDLSSYVETINDVDPFAEVSISSTRTPPMMLNKISEMIHSLINAIDNGVDAARADKTRPVVMIDDLAALEVALGEGARPTLIGSIPVIQDLQDMLSRGLVSGRPCNTYIVSALTHTCCLYIVPGDLDFHPCGLRERLSWRQ